jgi:ETFB lysine methyltransferase
VREVDVGPHAFRLTLPANPDEFLGDADTLANPPGDDYVPYWPHLWPAALPMAAIVGAAGWTKGTAALELGCGVGLVGLAGLAAGLDVTFSDYEPAAIELARANAADNGFPHAAALLLDWRHPLPRRFPVILACEVVYEVRNHEPLLSLLDVMLAAGGVCWIGDAGRQAAADFIDLARSRRYAVELRNERGESLPSPQVGRFQLVILRQEVHSFGK